MYFVLLFIVCHFHIIYCYRGIYDGLIKDIFTDYNTGIRPVKELETTIEVGIHFGIIQLLDVGDKSKTIECVSFMALSWKDELLSWDPKEYNNITEFRYPHSFIWKPDIILTNTPDLNEGPVMNKASTNVQIKYDGTINNEYTAVYKATCHGMDMTNFPFDHHHCYFDFASWTYTQKELDIYDASSEFDVTESMQFLPNAEWDVYMTGTEKMIENDTVEKQSYPTWRIKVTLARKPLYFLVTIIIPITITCYISFLGMFSPSTNTGERTEKAFLGITTLLAVSLLMLTVSAQMPVTSNAVPLMGYFLGVYILTIAVAIICTTIIMHIDVQGLHGRPLPNCVKRVFLERLGKWLRIYKKSADEREKQRPEPCVQNLCFKPLENDVALGSKKEYINVIQNMLNLHFQSLLNERAVSKRKKEQNQLKREEWSQLCMVLDSICLFVFLVWSTVFTIAVLSN